MHNKLIPSLGAQPQESDSALTGAQPRLLHQELTHRLNVALGRLTPMQQDLFHRHCTEGQSLFHIARTTDHSHETVRQSYCQLRQRLQELLIQTGLGPGETMDYLYQALTCHQ